tara:strand:+ start:97 stop:273 length:177 start_codon:yes stop_codon:yes gene_type:complete
MDTEYLKVFGVNGSVLGAVTLTQIETVLSIVLLLVTIVWTTTKLISLFEGKTNKNKDD